MFFFILDHLTEKEFYFCLAGEIIIILSITIIAIVLRDFEFSVSYYGVTALWLNHSMNLLIICLLLYAFIRLLIKKNIVFNEKSLFLGRIKIEHSNIKKIKMSKKFIEIYTNNRKCPFFFFVLTKNEIDETKNIFQKISMENNIPIKKS